MKNLKMKKISMIALITAAVTIGSTTILSNGHKLENYMSGEIEREVLITAEDGREIFYHIGNSPITVNHKDRYVVIYDDHEKQRVIYYGITDTVQIAKTKEGGV